MNAPAQLKINLPEQLQSLLQEKASRFGVPLTQYVKHLIMKDVEDEEYPVFKASEATKMATKQSLKDFNKAVDAKDFFKQLHNEG